jgi:hypothetical protein
VAVSAAGRSSPLRCPRLRSNAISLVATRVTRLPPDQKAPTSDCHSRQVLFKLCYTGVAARPNPGASSMCPSLVLARERCCVLVKLYRVCLGVSTLLAESRPPSSAMQFHIAREDDGLLAA